MSYPDQPLGLVTAIYARIRSATLNEWHGQLWDAEINRPIGELFVAHQRGALIGLIKKWVPLTHLLFIDVDDPNW